MNAIDEALQVLADLESRELEEQYSIDPREQCLNEILEVDRTGE